MFYIKVVDFKQPSVNKNFITADETLDFCFKRKQESIKLN